MIAPQKDVKGKFRQSLTNSLSLADPSKTGGRSERVAVIGSQCLALLSLMGQIVFPMR